MIVHFHFIDFQVASVEQYVLILDLFFRKYATESGQVWTRADLEVNIRCRTILEEFLAVALGNHLFGRNATYSVQFRSTLIFVASVLQSSWNSTERHERHDFLFYAVTYFLAQMFPAAHVSIGDEGIPLVLLKALSAYEVTVDKAAWTTVFSGKYAIGDWTSKLLSLESKIENLHDNVLLPSFEERLPGSPTETTTLVQLVKEVNVDAHPQTGAQVDLNGTQNCQENTVVQAVATETGQTMPAPLQGSEAAVDPMSTSESDNQTTTSAEDDHDIGGENTPTRLSLVESEREEASPQDIDVLSAQGNQTTVLLDSQKHHEMHNEQQSLRGGQSGFNLNAELDNIQTKFDGTLMVRMRDGKYGVSSPITRPLGMQNLCPRVVRSVDKSRVKICCRRELSLLNNNRCGSTYRTSNTIHRWFAESGRRTKWPKTSKISKWCGTT